MSAAKDVAGTLRYWNRAVTDKPSDNDIEAMVGLLSKEAPALNTS